jgi:hypothetical protein
MRKLFQKEWFGISFKECFNASDVNFVTDEQYDAFYRVYEKKYKSFDDLPFQWKEEKNKISKDIYECIKPYNRILSIGSGNCYIETQLLKYSSLNKSFEIVAIEPHVKQGGWGAGLPEKIITYSGFFPEVLHGDFDFDIAYASGLDYCFNDLDYRNFLLEFKRTKIKYLLLADIVNIEKSCIDLFKYYIKQALSAVSLYDRGQFWGYSRTLKEHKSTYLDLGFTIEGLGKHYKNSYWILLSIKP